MSTKTIKQRIAVVAVSALTAGVLSVIAAPAANAANITYANTSTIGVAGQVNIGTTPSTTGSAVVGATTTLGVPNTMRSVGFVTKTSTTGTVLGTTAIQFGDDSAAGGVNDTAGSLVVLAGAKIAWSATGAATAGVGVSAVLSGGGTLSDIVSSAAGNAVAATTLNGSSTIAWVDAPSGDVTHLGGVLNVSAPVGSTLNLSFFNGANVNGTSSATAGELMASITFTVAAASASGVYSASTSTVTTQAPVAKGTVAAGTNAFDNTDRIANGSVGIIYIELDDAYTANITSGVVAVNATNGSTVAVADAASDTGAEAYAATSSFSTLAAATAEMYVYVNQPVANTAGSTTVNITLDGVNVGTKTLNWSGDIASISILSSTKSSFANGVTQADCTAGAPSIAGTAGNVVYSVRDAAGNAVTLATSPTVTGATGALLGATITSGTSGTAANGCVRQTSALGYGAATMIVPATTLQGAGTFKLRVQNAAGVNIDSAAFNATVSNGSTNKFVASWDKASYAPGELAKLTIKALDEKGNSMAAGNVNTGLALSVASGFTAVGTACEATTLMDSAGEISCQYAAGNTEGAYSFSVDLTTATPQSATVGAIAVKATTATVSNADVLKSIVALIASINKQIQALQKLILRR